MQLGFFVLIQTVILPLVIGQRKAAEGILCPCHNFLQRAPLVCVNHFVALSDVAVGFRVIAYQHRNVTGALPQFGINDVAHAEYIDYDFIVGGDCPGNRDMSEIQIVGFCKEYISLARHRSWSS